MTTLTGRITDVTGRSPDSIASITVKAPSARIGGGSDIIVTSPAKVTLSKTTGDITISGLHVGLSWLYIEGDGWSDSIPLAVAEGFQLILEAVANASGVPGIADYMLMIRNSEDHARLLARAAVDGEIGEVVRLAQTAAVTAEQAATSADVRARSAETKVDAYTPRVDSLEAMAGLSPESPVDGQTANLISQPTTLTRQTLDGHFTQAPIDLSGRGVSHLKTAAENTPIILDAIDEVADTGRQILLPYCPPTAWIDVNQELVIPGGMSVMGHGQGRTRLRQLKRMAPLIDVVGSDVEIGGFTGKQTTENPTSAERTSWRGEPGTGKLAVVRVQADRVNVKNVTGANANAVVHFAAWDVIADAQRHQLAQCRAINIHSIDCVFGLLAVGVEDFYFDNITGNYLRRPGWNTPPHLLYFSEGLGGNIDIRGGTAYAKNGLDGQAFQFKGVKGGNVASLRARDCEGLLNLILNEDLGIDTLISMGDNYAGGLYASLVVQGVNKRVTIQDVTIRMASSGKPVRIMDESEDVKISRLNAVSNHTAAPTSGGTSFDVDIDGVRTEVHDATVQNVGSVAWGSSIGIFGGTDNRISRPVTSGNNFGVTVRGSATGSVIEDYDLDELGTENRAFDMTTRATLFPRRHTGAVSPERTPALVDDGSTTRGTFSEVFWPQVGPQWAQVAGAWRGFPGGVLTVNVATFLNALLTAPIGKSNIRVTGDVIYQDRVGFAVRVTDRNNLITGRINHAAGAAEIVKRVEAVETVLASVPLVPTMGSVYHLDFSASGDYLRLVVDDSLEVEHTLTPEDLALFPATSHGLFFHGSLEGGFKNIIMY